MVGTAGVMKYSKFKGDNMKAEETIKQAQYLYYSNAGNLTKRQCAKSVPTPDGEDLRDVYNIFDISSIDYIEGEI